MHSTRFLSLSAGKNLAEHFDYIRERATLDEIVVEAKRMLIQLLLALADVHKEVRPAA